LLPLFHSSIFFLLSSLPSTFFFYSSATPHPLHSFPTRRSSDLTVDPAAKRLYLSHATEVVVNDLSNNTVIGRIADTPGVHGIAVDRKSTRLNSSHLGISYAVFCLKKKKKKKT